MRKDIEIPKVTDVHIVAIKEWDKEFLSQNWFVYLVNNTSKTLSTVLVISRGADSDRKTSTLRHGLGDVAPFSAAKIELLPDEVLGFTNEYLLTFFNYKGLLHDKNFVFEAFEVSAENLETVPILDQAGIIAK
ncbi:MAG: hypothetical protein ABJM06_11675 [Gilvibacter sp.]